VHGAGHEESALQVHDRHGVDDCQPAPGRGPPQVGGAEDADRLALEERDEVAMAPDVVPGRQDVRPGGEKLLRQLRGDARPVRCVFPVDDAEVDRKLVPQALQPLVERAVPRGPEDVRDEENSQRYGDASVLAGCTSRWTCWPLSWV
jgi:hypothetical protein